MSPCLRFFAVLSLEIGRVYLDVCSSSLLLEISSYPPNLRSKFTFVKVLYFVVRYLALILHWFVNSPYKLANLTSPSSITLVFFGNINAKGMNSCSEIMRLISIVGTITIACSNILLIQRGTAFNVLWEIEIILRQAIILVYAFYGRSKPLLWSLLSLFVLSEASIVAITVIGVPRYRTTKVEGLPSLFGHCVIERYSEILSFIWWVVQNGKGKNLLTASTPKGSLSLRSKLFPSSALLEGSPSWSTRHGKRVCRILSYTQFSWGMEYGYFSSYFVSSFQISFLYHLWERLLSVCFLFSGIYMHSLSVTGLCFALWVLMRWFKYSIYWRNADGRLLLLVFV